MKNLNKFIGNNLLNILTIFLLLQPIIDLITGIQTKYFNSFLSIGVIIRFIFLGLIAYYILFISKSRYKKYSLYYFIFFIIYTLIFLITNIYAKDMSLVFEEIKWIIKNYYFPILLIGFINFFDDSKNRIEEKTFIKIILTYVVLIVTCKLLGIEANAYNQGKTGYIGLFYSANEISGILSILLPFYFFKKSEKSKIFLKIIMLLIIVYCTLMIGSKTAFLSLFIIVFIYLINSIIKIIKAKKYKYLRVLSFIVILTAIFSFVLIPQTAFYKNIKKHVDFLDINNIGEVFEKENINRLIFSDRLTFLDETKDIYDSSNTAAKIVGIGYAFENERKTIEMDYFDIFYCYGPLGFIIYFLPLCICLLVLIKKIKINEKTLPYVISLFLALILAFFTGHILSAPSVSIYVSLILAYMLNSNTYESRYDIIKK